MEKTKYLKDYKPSDFMVESINLTIELNEDLTLVTNEMKIKRAPEAKKSAPLILDGNNQELLSVQLDSKDLEKYKYKLDEQHLTIATDQDQFTVKVASKILPQNNTSLAGLFKAGDVFLTQCEPNGFSRITYFIDRPDVMTVFTTKLIASKQHPVLLSNGDQIDAGDLPGNKHFVTWRDKSKKPSYLFAAVIGDLKVREDIFVTKSGKKVDLKIYVPEKDLDQTAYAMESLKLSMKWDEEVYGREYDLNTYMIVGTPKFNMGAMENKGLNIFNDKYILANQDTASDVDYINVHDVIGHEYFHNWTGNRISIRNWFQLSLKEGLTVFREQEFSADQFGYTSERIGAVDYIRTVQFQEDSGPLSHPVQPDSYIKMDNFYTATVYEKGAEIARMLKTILGAENFYKGMNIYFDRYDGQAVTINEFVQAMHDASQIDLDQFKLWYTQAGTPILDISSDYDPKTKVYTLSVKQSCKNWSGKLKNKPFHIPIKLGLVGSKTGNALKFSYLGNNLDEVVLNLQEEEQKFILGDVSELPIPSLLRDFSAPVKINYPYSDGELLFLLANDHNEFNRWEASQKYFTNLLLKLTNDFENHKPLKLLESLSKAVQSVLNNQNLDKSFVVNAITLPTEKNIYNQLVVIDPEAVFEAKKFITQMLGKELQADWLALYNKLNAELLQKKYSLSKDDFDARALKNICLMYINRGDADLGSRLAEEQLNKADNLTDRIAALRILFNSKDDAVYHKAVEEFYNKWHMQELVVAKWLMLQALSERPDTLKRVRELTKHPAFDIKTPNKVRSLFGALAENNTVFHAADGSGYNFYADFVLELDPINHEVAARLVKAFDSWRKFEPKRRALMRTALQKIKNQPGLSDNVREIVEKILAGE